MGMRPRATRYRVCYPLWLTTFALMATGVLFVFSASVGYRGAIMTREVMWVIVGFCVATGVSLINCRDFRHYAAIFYIGAIASLVIVLLIGQERNGARSWLGFFGLGIQPSEFAKIAVIFIFGRYLADFEEHRYDIRYYLVSFALLFIPLLLIMLQPDLGTALVYLPVVLAMFYVSGTRQSLLALPLCGGVAFFPVLWQVMTDRQKQRILLTWSPEKDPYHFGYQAIQSKIAIGSGLLTGRGYLQSVQSRLNFLPERHTDFVFSVIGEEWGFIGSVVVVLLYVSLVATAFYVARRAHDTFGEVVAVGIGILFATHALMNVGMAVGLLPIIGVPLPLLSYGGSSFLTSMILIGVLQSIYGHSIR